MTQRSDIPFNIDILKLKQEQLDRMRPVISLDTYLGATKNFHPDGLYSSEIFGVPGTPMRETNFSYLDLRVSIIHPTLYRALVQVRSFYGDILDRREYAKWNPETLDFDRSDMTEGRTGFQFFCEYLPRIQFPTNETETRKEAVALLEKYRKDILMPTILIMPAGYREFEVDDNGRESVNEINDYYYKLIASRNTINPVTVKTSPEAYDVQRSSMQRTFNTFYDLLTKMIEGKRNLFVGKFLGRKINNGTRNVITPQNELSRELGHPRNVSINSALVGLYQFSKSVNDVTLERLKNDFLDKVFTTPGAPARLCDPDTFQVDRVTLKAESYGYWLGVEGLSKQLNYFEEETIRHNPIKIEGKYLGLVYRGPDMTFALIHGLDDLPQDRRDVEIIQDVQGWNQRDKTKGNVMPISLTDLLYHALYPVASKYFGFITRYPITGVGSVYAARAFLKTTIQFEERTELDPFSWQPFNEPNRIAYQFPVPFSSFFNSLAPHASRLARMGADFDGDWLH